MTKNTSHFIAGIVAIIIASIFLIGKISDDSIARGVTTIWDRAMIGINLVTFIMGVAIIDECIRKDINSSDPPKPE